MDEQATTTVSTEVLEQTETPGRDYAAEVSLLLEQNPELKEDYMSEEVFCTLINADKPLPEAFRDYKFGKIQAENAELKKQIDALKQNIESAKAAPVKAVADGGNPSDEIAGDPFLTGLYSI